MEEIAKGVADGWIIVENLSPAALLTALEIDLDEGEESPRDESRG